MTRICWPAALAGLLLGLLVGLAVIVPLLRGAGL